MASEIETSSSTVEESSSMLSMPQDIGTPKLLCLDNKKEQIMIDEHYLTDENGNSHPMNEPTINLSPQSSDHLEKIPNCVMDAGDSVNISCETHSMETSFQFSKTEGDTPKASSSDFQKVESPRKSLRKKVKIPAHKKIGAKIDTKKSGQIWEKLIKSSPVKMKDTASDKRKVRKKVKNQVEKILSKEKLSRSPLAHHKIGCPSKDGENIIHIPFSVGTKKVKIFHFKVFNNNSKGKINYSGIDDLWDESIPSTSTQVPEIFEYTCRNCNFESSKVNNLIAHLKYRVCKPYADRIDYQLEDMERRRRRLEFSGSGFSQDENF